MNLGQLALLLRGHHLVDVHSYTKVAGLPFRAEELQNVFLDHLNVEHPRADHLSGVNS